MTSPSLHCTLAARRQALGLTVTELAARVGVSRQTLTSVEAGRTTPSTQVALRLAQALSCSVEDLFQLPDEGLSGLRQPQLAGRRVWLGRVAQQWTCHALPGLSTAAADGWVRSDGSIELFAKLPELAEVSLVAGCAPVLGVLAQLMGQTPGPKMRWIPCSSGDALRALTEGRVHMAGLHLADHDRPDQHDLIARAALGSDALSAVHLLSWREGWVTHPRNPLGLGAVADLQRSDVRVAQRSPDSGAARALSRSLRAPSAGSPVTEGPRVTDHEHAAQAVLLGAADSAVLIEPVATALGLPFHALTEERFELLVRTEMLQHAGVRALLNALSDLRTRRVLQGLPGYDLSTMGTLRRVPETAA